MKNTKKKQQIKFKFLCPIFGVEVCLNLGEIDKDNPPTIFGAEYTPNGDSSAETTTIISEKNGEKIEVGYHVWVKDKTDYHSMVHETLHLVKRILDKKGIPFDGDNEELIAYYQGYWVRKFWHKMSKFIDEKENK